MNARDGEQPTSEGGCSQPVGVSIGVRRATQPHSRGTPNPIKMADRNTSYPAWRAGRESDQHNLTIEPARWTAVSLSCTSSGSAPSRGVAAAAPVAVAATQQAVLPHPDPYRATQPAYAAAGAWLGPPCCDDPRTANERLRRHRALGLATGGDAHLGVIGNPDPFP